TAGNVYISDTGNHRVRVVSTSGIIRTIAGTGVSGFAGDGAAAGTAQLNLPFGVVVDKDGAVYVSDHGNSRVRKLTPLVTPAPLINGVSNAFSGSAQNAPGGLFSIYGANLAASDAQTPGAPWPLNLGGATVTINGIRAPLYFASARQINGQIPYE